MGRRSRKRGAARLDLSDLKHLLRDHRCWVDFGIVTLLDGETTHYEVVSEGGEVSVYVDVEAVPSGIEHSCRLGSSGAIRVPSVGEEVAIVLPQGELDFIPIIVATFPASMPDGVAENVTVIANTRVLVHDGSGGAKELAFKDDVQAVRDDLNIHEHLYIPGNKSPILTTGGPSVTSPVGTAVLKST